MKACGELAFAVLSGGLLGGEADRVRALDAGLREHLTAGALALGGALTLCEGWVLYRGLTWGPWLVVFTTGSLLPFLT